MTKKELAQAIDELGEKKAEQKRLEKEIESLSKKVRKEIAVNTSVESASGDYEASLIEVSSAKLDPAEVYKLLKKDRFLQVATVTKKAVEPLLTKEEIGRCSTYVTTHRLDVRHT